MVSKTRVVVTTTLLFMTRYRFDRARGLPRLPKLLLNAIVFYISYRLLLTAVNPMNNLSIRPTKLIVVSSCIGMVWFIVTFMYMVTSA